MGHSEQYQRDLDAADNIEQSVLTAFERAKSGAATNDDWQLLEWAIGFSSTSALNTF